MSEPKKMSRRGFLKGVAGAAVAGVGGSLLPKGAHSQARSLAIWHTEPADSTVKAVQKVCDRFSLVEHKRYCASSQEVKARKIAKAWRKR